MRQGFDISLTYASRPQYRSYQILLQLFNHYCGSATTAIANAGNSD
jgi:hypothetical protein